MSHSSSDFDAKKVFFPVTANPLAFHHLILAECVLQQFESVEEICFILSNGVHPDPYKTHDIPEKLTRLTLAQCALNDFAQPHCSHVARLAKEHNFSLKLSFDHCSIDIKEFQEERAFRLVEHVQRVQKKEDGTFGKGAGWVPLMIGADLLQRMKNTDIFSDADLQILATRSCFLIAERKGLEVEQTVQELQKKRNIQLNFISLNQKLLPTYLHPFLKYSSTHIRSCILSNQNLETLLSESAISVLKRFRIYR